MEFNYSENKLNIRFALVLVGFLVLALILWGDTSNIPATTLAGIYVSFFSLLAAGSLTAYDFYQARKMVTA